MAWVKKNWWVLLLAALVVVWYSLPSITRLFWYDPYWLSAPGQALRANLRQASAIVLVVGVAFQLVMRAVGVASIHRIYLRGRSEPYQDVSERAVPPPEQAASTVAALTALGFSRLGEVEGPLGIRKGQKTLHWLFVDAEGVARASVTLWKWMATPGVALHSDFADGAAVLTYFPLGHRTRRRGLWLGLDKQSIEGAYRLHQAHVLEFQQGHGDPIQVTSVQEHLDLNVEFDKRHGRTIWWSLQLPHLIFIGSLLLITAALLFALLSLPGMFGPVIIDLTSDAMAVSIASIAGIYFFVASLVEARRFFASL